MKQSKNSYVVLLFVSVILASLIALLWIRPWYEPPKTKVIKVAYLPIYVDLPLFVAVEENFFRKRKLNVELVRFQSSPDMAAALLSGKVDAVASIATSSALAVESRDPGKFKIFLVDAETPENPLSSLLVSSSSSITKPEELKGKIIGSFPGPTAKLFAPLAFSKYGLSKKDYTIQEMEIGSHITALETGNIDAVVTYEPTATQAVLKYRSKKIVPGFIEKNVINPWQAGVWIISSTFLNQRKEQAINFVHAIYDAVDLLRKNPDRAKESLSSFTTIDLAIANKTPNIPFTKVWEADLVTLQRHSDLLTKEGTLSKKIDIPSLVISEIPKNNILD